MKKMKGFTLIELLAVIAILAIILMIAVPKVLDTISSSKTNTKTSSARLIWKTAEQCIAMETMTAGSCTGGTNGTHTTLGNLGTFAGTYSVIIASGSVTSVTVVPTGGTTCTITAVSGTCS